MARLFYNELQQYKTPYNFQLRKISESAPEDCLYFVPRYSDYFKCYRRSIHIRDLPVEATKEQVNKWCLQVIYNCINPETVSKISESLIRRSWLSEPTPKACPRQKIAHVEFLNKEIRDFVKQSASDVKFNDESTLRVLFPLPIRMPVLGLTRE